MKYKAQFLLMIVFWELHSTPVWGQQRKESMEGLFDNLMKSFEMDMDRQMKRFENFFKGGPFLDMDFGSNAPEPFWRETQKQRILVFKVDASEEGIPFNIQIKDGHIIVKGTVRKQEKTTDPTTGSVSTSTNIYQFQHGPVPIPSDVDEGGVKIEKQKDEVLIRFPKKKSGKSSKKSGEPLPRDKGDVTI